MNELIKIKDMTSKYDISARTLRYYEDMGLLESVRSDDYTYRMYDEAAAKRLEQILVLRRLNIGIKDIKRVVQGGKGILETHWHWTPLLAHVTDKYNVGWMLCV